MLHLLVDMSTWLDLARRRDGQRVIVLPRLRWEGERQVSECCPDQIGAVVGSEGRHAYHAVRSK